MKRNKFILHLLIALSGISCIEAKSVIETQEKIDLSLAESQANSNNSLVKIIDQTVTSFGQKKFEEILSNPTSDKSVIIKRQKLIRFLLDHPETRSIITKHLTTIRDHEEFMSLFIQYQQSPMHDEILKVIFFCHSLLEKHCPSLLATLNESEIALTLRHYIPTDIVGPIFDVLIFHFLVDFFQAKYADHTDKKCHADHSKDHHHGHSHSADHTDKECHTDHSKDHHHGHSHSHDIPDKAPAPVKFLMRSAETLHGAFQFLNLIEGINHAIDRHAIISIIHKQVSTTMLCIQAMNEIHLLLASLDLIGTEKSSSNELLQDLTYQLKTLEAPEEGGSFFLPVGKILTGYKKLLASLPELALLSEEIGTIDAHLSTARLIEEHKTKDHRYCFVDFVESQKPTFIAQDLWNPILTNNIPVTNNINLGTQTPTKLVITSPNKAGKTSTMKAVALNAVLAQTFGIAAANSLAITPFEKVVTYVHLNDDITQDQSMFIAEVLRADYCFRTLQENKEQPVLLLIDDSLFKSTNSMKGEQLAYDFIKTLKDFDHAIVLIATHFPLLTKLEEQTNRAFTNYHIHLEQDAQGHLHSTYKLEVGSDIEHDSFTLINGTSVMQGLCCK